VSTIGIVAAPAARDAIAFRIGSAPLTPPATAILNQASVRPLTPIQAPEIQGAERFVLETALIDGAVAGFRSNIRIAGALVILAGIVAFAAVQNPVKDEQRPTP